MQGTREEAQRKSNFDNKPANVTTSHNNTNRYSNKSNSNKNRKRKKKKQKRGRCLRISGF